MHNMNLCSTLPAGRTPTEKNDCTVVALHYTTGLPYAACRAIASQAGRETGRGFNLDLLFADCAKRNLTFTKVEIPRHALNVVGLPYFYPEGIYYAWITAPNHKSHAIALVNGVIHDPACAGNQSVIGLWKYNGTVHSSADSIFD